MSAPAEFVEVDRKVVKWYLVPVTPPPPTPTPVPTPTPTPVPPIKWERVAISALVGALVGALGYGVSKKGWVGALSGIAGAGLTYFLVPLPEG
jgi:hypothetical protein